MNVTVAILQDSPFGRAGQVRELSEPWAQALEARGEVTSDAELVAKALELQGGVMIATEAPPPEPEAPAEPEPEPAPAEPEAPPADPAAFPPPAQDYSPI